MDSPFTIEACKKTNVFISLICYFAVCLNTGKMYFLDFWFIIVQYDLRSLVFHATKSSHSVMFVSTMSSLVNFSGQAQILTKFVGLIRMLSDNQQYFSNSMALNLNDKGAICTPWSTHNPIRAVQAKKKHLNKLW